RGRHGASGRALGFGAGTAAAHGHGPSAPAGGLRGGGRGLRRLRRTHRRRRVRGRNHPWVHVFPEFRSFAGRGGSVEPRHAAERPLCGLVCHARVAGGAGGAVVALPGAGHPGRGGGAAVPALHPRREVAVRRTGLPLPLSLALGGLLLGGVLVGMPQMAGNGYSVVVSLLHQPQAWEMVLWILLCKVLATSLTAGSGAVGGVFTPTLFVGAALGTLFAQGLGAVW